MFDKRLHAAGKAAKVASTACMRTLLTILHARMKHHKPWQPLEVSIASHTRPLDHEDSCSAPASLRLSGIEAYPEDKYLPSYLALAKHYEEVFPLLFATDVTGENVRIVVMPSSRHGASARSAFILLSIPPVPGEGRSDRAQSAPADSHPRGG